MTKPTAELIAWLEQKKHPEYTAGSMTCREDNKNYQAVKDRLAEQEAEITRLKKAHNAFESYINGWVSSDYAEWGDEIYQHVLRGGQYNGEEINEYHPIEKALPDYKALQQTTEVK